MPYVPCAATKLTQNLALDCDEQRIKGYEPLGILIDRADIDFDLSAVDATNPRRIIDIVLLATKKTSIIYNDRNNPAAFSGTKTETNSDLNMFNKTVTFYIEGIGADYSKNAAEPLKDHDYVAIIPRKDHNGKGSFQVFGWKHGLSVKNEGGSMVQDEETGYTLVTMTCIEKFMEYELAETDSYVDNLVGFEALKALSY